MDTISRGGSEGVQAFDKLANLAAEIRSVEYKRLLIDVGVMARENDSLYQVIQGAKQGLQAASQGAVAAAGAASDGKKTSNQESYYVQQRPLSEGQVYLLFKKIDQQQDIVMEGPMDLVKKGLGAVGKAASWVGKQTTEKITSAKLFASWKLEGSPTDSEELAKFLQGQGVSDDIVTQVYTDMKLPVPGAAPAAGAVDIETVKQMIAKLPVDRKARLLTYMLGGKKAMKQPAAEPEENPNIVKGTESVSKRGRLL
jgi:hypothetical protein